MFYNREQLNKLNNQIESLQAEYKEARKEYMKKDNYERVMSTVLLDHTDFPHRVLRSKLKKLYADFERLNRNNISIEKRDDTSVFRAIYAMKQLMK